MANPFFRLTIDGAVAHLEMNRPDKANGMNPAFWRELPEHVRALDADPKIRALAITGAGKHFTGGMDLAAFGQVAALASREPGRAAYAMRTLIRDLQGAFDALEKARFPVIAAVHGACIGAGVDMISACDIRLASAEASFAIEEIHIGMAADVGTLQRMPKLVAPGIVKELAFTGRRFSAAEAKAFGFVNEIVADREAVVARALELARAVAEKSPLAIAGIKRAIDYARDHPVADSLEQIATWNAGMLRPQDLMGAIEARMARKQALFDDLLAG